MSVIRLIDSYTRENVTYEETYVWHDGTQMDDSKVDNVIYRKKGGKYYVDCGFQSGSPINIKRFGVIGNGVLDDTIALNKALSNPFKIAILFPSGCVAYTTSQVSISSNKRLYGGGEITTGNNNIHHALVLSNANNVIVEDIKISAKNGENGFDGAIVIKNTCENITIRKCVIDNIGLFKSQSDILGTPAGHGIWTMDGGTFELANKNITIENNEITNIKGDGNTRGDFISAIGCDGLRILNNSMDTCQRQGIAIENRVKNFLIDGNTIKNPGSCGIDIEGFGSDLNTRHIREGIITKNRIENYGMRLPETIGGQDYAVDFHDYVEKITFSNNICISGSKGKSHVYAINSAQYLTISDNKFIGSVSGPACLMYSGSSSDYWKISNNEFIGLTGSCLQTYKGIGCEFSNNKCYSTSGTGALINNPIGIRIFDNLFKGFSRGVFINTTEANTYFVINNNYIECIDIGVELKALSFNINYSELTNNYLKGNSTAGSVAIKITKEFASIVLKIFNNNLYGYTSTISGSIDVTTPYSNTVVSTGSISSPYQGMVAYFLNTNKVMQYNNSAWV